MRMTSGDTWVSVEAFDTDVEVRVRLCDDAAMGADLEGAGLEVFCISEASAVDVVESSVWSVGALSGAGGLAALVAALRAFWRRHDAKTVTIETSDGEKFTVTGFSPETTERMIRSIWADQAYYEESMRQLDADVPDTGPVRSTK